jgi:hypothetical protein
MWLHPPPAISYEFQLALNWLRVTGPTPDGIAAYNHWLSQGCPDLDAITPRSVPPAASNFSYVPEVMHILYWDNELRDFMDVRSAASLPRLDREPSPPGSLLAAMVNNFEQQLLHRMAVILQERRRLNNKIVLLLEAVELCNSILDICFRI